MSDSSPTTLAGALYGPSGPAASPQGPTGMTDWPASAEARTAPATVQATPQRESVATALYGAQIAPEAPTAPAIDPASDPATSSNDNPASGPDPIRAEFDAIAGDLALNPEASEQLLALHGRAVAAQQAQHEQTAAAWRTQAEREFSPAQLGDIRYRLDRAIGTDAAAVEFKRLLAWSGIGNSPAAIRVISRLLARR